MCFKHALLLVNDIDKIAHHLNVVSCALAKPKENDDWRGTLIFQTHKNWW